MSGPRAGGLDWVARWAEMRRACERSGSGSRLEVDRWAHRAERFGRHEAGSSPDRELPAWLVELLSPSTTVVDVGAGTGRHALWFAERCRFVVAVEPSAAMRAVLERRVAERAATNVRIVAAAWPLEAPQEPADLVFSSHVLYGVDDVGSFVRAMSAVATRLCVLLLGLRAPTSALDPLRRAVLGEEPAPRPAALEALALLHQLGIPANLEVLPSTRREYVVLGDDDELDELARRLHLTPDSRVRGRLRAALSQLAPGDARGAHRIGVTGPHALLWWAPGDSVAALNA